MSRAGKIGLAGIGLLVIVSVVFGVYRYELTRQEQVAEARVQLETGIWQFNNKDYEAALQTLRAIPKGTVEDWRKLYYEGAALVQLRNYEEATAVLEEAWSLNQTEEDIPFALAVAYFKQGNLQLAKGYFHAVIQINPQNADAKGLMDIMASLERMQPGAAETETPAESAEETGSEEVAPEVDSPALTDK
jgi:Flp pilus assembly protein TadD